MSIISLPQMKELPRPSRLLGLDVGTKTIGLAVCDTTWTIASPLKTITRKTKKLDWLELQKTISEFSPVGLVVGLPINMSGEIGKQAEYVLNFVDYIEENSDIPIILWDERMSTQAVTRTLLAADVSRKKRDAVVDKLAASYILQGLLDSV